MKTISENSDKRVGLFRKWEKRGIFMTPYSEILGEIGKPGTMMDTQPFTGDDHPGSIDINRRKDRNY